MRTYLLYNALVLGVIGLAAIVFTIVYFVIKRKKEKCVFNLLKISTILLAMALILTSVGNYFFMKDVNSKRGKYNRVDVVPITQETTDMYASIYARFAESGSIQGYNKTVKCCGNVEYSFFINKHYGDHIYPGFIIFAEHVGADESNSFNWVTISVNWMKDGSIESENSYMGNYESKKLMLIGDYVESIDELHCRTDYIVSAENKRIESSTVILSLN